MHARRHTPAQEAWVPRGFSPNCQTLFKEDAPQEEIRGPRHWPTGGALFYGERCGERETSHEAGVRRRIWSKSARLNHAQADQTLHPGRGCGFGGGSPGALRGLDGADPISGVKEISATQKKGWESDVKPASFFLERASPSGGSRSHAHGEPGVREARVHGYTC